MNPPKWTFRSLLLVWLGWLAHFCTALNHFFHQKTGRLMRYQVLSQEQAGRWMIECLFVFVAVIRSRPIWPTYLCHTTCPTARRRSRATSTAKTIGFWTRTWRPRTGCSRPVKSCTFTTRRPVWPRRRCAKSSRKISPPCPPKCDFCKTKVGRQSKQSPLPLPTPSHRAIEFK